LPRPFSEILGELDYGAVSAAATEKLAALVLAVDEHQKPGTLTLTLSVKPNGSGKALVDAKITAKAPEAMPDQSNFFARTDGSLTRTSPKQDEARAEVANRQLAAV